MIDNVSLFLDLWRQSASTLASAQDRFRSTTHVFVVTSFGLSAFILGKDGAFGSHALVLAGAADVVLVAVFFVLGYLSIAEIRLARAAVEDGQRALQKAVDGTPPGQLFPPVGHATTMPLHNELLTAVVVAAFILLKAAVLFEKSAGLF